MPPPQHRPGKTSSHVARLILAALEARPGVGRYAHLPLGAILHQPDGSLYVKFLGRKLTGQVGDYAAILVEHLDLT